LHLHDQGNTQRKDAKDAKKFKNMGVKTMLVHAALNGAYLPSPVIAISFENHHYHLSLWTFFSLCALCVNAFDLR